MSIQPHQINNNLTGLFPPAAIAPPTGMFDAQSDFGRVIKELLFSKAHPDSSDRYLRDVKLVAEREGFQVKESQIVLTERDYRFFINNTSFIVPNAFYSGDHFETAKERCNYRINFRKERAAITTIPENKHKFIGYAGQFKNILRDILEPSNPDVPALYPNNLKSWELGKEVPSNFCPERVTIADRQGTSEDENLKVKPTKPKTNSSSCSGIYSRQMGHMYFEGGNLFRLTSPNGKKVVLCGEDNVTVTHMMLRRMGFFKAPDKESPAFPYEKCRSEQWQDSTSNAYLSGEIPAKIKALEAKISPSFTEEKVQGLFFEMLAMGLLKSPNLATPADRKKAKEITVNYLAERTFVEQTIIPYDLKVESGQVVFLPQIDYHLDCLMTPGPGGSILLQDFDKSCELLQKIRPHLTGQEDLKLLDQMIDSTSKEGQAVKEVMQKTRKILEEAGFTVTLTPGAFFAVNSGKTKRVNFFNAISGFSPKTNQHYYIIGGTSLGKKLGSLLMDAFTLFLKSQCNAAIYFVGRNPRDPADFSSAEKLLNDLYLGVHCLSLETK